VIHWYSDNALIDDTFSNKVGTDGLVSINELYLPKLNRNDLNKAITCVATNNNLTNSLNKTIHLDISCEYTLSYFYLNIDFNNCPN